MAVPLRPRRSSRTRSQSPGAVAVVWRAIDRIALGRDLVAVAAGHPRDGPGAVARQVQEHDDVPDLHGVGLAGQQPSIAAPGVLLVFRQADAPSSEVGQVLEIKIRSIAPSLPQSTGQQLAPEAGTGSLPAVSMDFAMARWSVNRLGGWGPSAGLVMNTQTID